MFGRLIPYDINVQQFLAVTRISNPILIDAVNSLTLNLKAAGLWDSLSAIYPLIGGTAGPQSHNLKNVSQYRLSFTGTINYTSTGLEFSGDNQSWADTEIAENSFYADGSGANIHLSAQVYRSGVVLNDLMGIGPAAISGATSQGSYIGFDGNDAWFGQARGRRNQQYTSAANQATSGFYLVSRRPTSSGELYYQKDGTGGTGASVNEGTIGSNYNYYLGGTNTGGVTVNNPLSGEITFSTLGAGLSNTQAVTLYNLVQTFNAKVGKPTS